MRMSKPYVGRPGDYGMLVTTQDRLNDAVAEAHAAGFQVGVHANGDVQPCMAWSRAPLGNLARESFDEIWNGGAMRALREEFDAQQPGVDCRHCVISKDETREFDDFYFRMLNKSG